MSVDCSESGETPTGKHELKTPQERGTSDEEAEAMPVESEPTVAEINTLVISTYIEIDFIADGSMKK